MMEPVRSKDQWVPDKAEKGDNSWSKALMGLAGREGIALDRRGIQDEQGEMRVLAEMDRFRGWGLRSRRSSHLMTFILSRKDGISPPTPGEVEKGVESKAGMTGYEREGGLSQ